MRWVLPLAGLAGCPYIWEAPTDPPVDPTGVPDPPPSIVAVRISPLPDAFQLEIAAEDDGEALTVQVDGPHGPLLDGWVAGPVHPAEPLSFELPWPNRCTEVDAEATLTLTDDADQAVSTTLSLRRNHLDVRSDAVLTPPTTVCGTAPPDAPLCLGFVLLNVGRIQVDAEGDVEAELRIADWRRRRAAPTVFLVDASLEGRTASLCLWGEDPWRVGVTP